MTVQHDAAYSTKIDGVTTKNVLPKRDCIVGEGTFQIAILDLLDQSASIESLIALVEVVSTSRFIQDCEAETAQLSIIGNVSSAHRVQYPSLRGSAGG